MTIDTLVLMLLIGIVIGGIGAVLLRGGIGIFITNTLLGVIGAAIGGMLPLFVGDALVLDTSNQSWLLRAIIGAFALVLVASLFRSARPRRLR
ncbi:MAG: GlsB/YeaQ/YmgE family stress response membrane protein [Gammaproteobacteria bacterium]|nr:MAG: GlsB/YeaQ/YmgE family stress response membrane protein [Gammaproteobacteria bacterium]